MSDLTLILLWWICFSLGWRKPLTESVTCSLRVAFASPSCWNAFFIINTFIQLTKTLVLTLCTFICTSPLSFKLIKSLESPLLFLQTRDSPFKSLQPTSLPTSDSLHILSHCSTRSNEAVNTTWTNTWLEDSSCHTRFSPMEMGK